VIEKERPAAIAVTLARLGRLSSRRRDAGGRPMAQPLASAVTMVRDGERFLGRTRPARPARRRRQPRHERGADAVVEPAQFAYPFGAWSPGVANQVADLGFSAAYTTDGSAISWRSSPHALPRVPVEGQAPGDFSRMLTNLAGR
jgi:hypothetical protein